MDIEKPIEERTGETTAILITIELSVDGRVTLRVEWHTPV